MNPGFLIFVGIFVGIPVGAFAGALQWTVPGSAQRRRRRILAVLATALATCILAAAVGAGIAEGRQATAESDANQFGVGWLFTSWILSLPLVLADFGIVGALLLPGRRTSARVASVVVMVILAGFGAWLGLLFVMATLEHAFHP